MTPKLKRILLPTAAILFWVALWWGVAAIFQKPLLLPTPGAVLRALWGLCKTGDFWRTVLISLSRISLGILLALVGGVLLALLTVKSRLCHHLFSPVLTLFKATPVASIIFLMLLWVGRERVPLLIAFMMALPIVWANIREGLCQTDKRLLEMASVFGMSRGKTLLHIRIPSVLPFFLSACRSAISLAWKAGIAAEVLCTPKSSIGLAIYEGKLYLLTDQLFAYTLTVILLSVAIEATALLLLSKAQKHTQKEVDGDAAA